MTDGAKCASVKDESHEDKIPSHLSEPCWQQEQTVSWEESSLWWRWRWAEVRSSLFRWFTASDDCCVRLTSSMLWETERKVLIQGCTCGLTAELLSSASPSCTKTGQRHIRHMPHLLPFLLALSWLLQLSRCFKNHSGGHANKSQEHVPFQICRDSGLEMSSWDCLSKSQKVICGDILFVL